jgi:hypothetical protein
VLDLENNYYICKKKVMGISQIVMLVLLSLNLLMGAHFHGKERTGKYSFWVTTISVAIYMSLLITGGFFN